ncbi:MAG: hypothetical protein J6112_07865, partial [Clostridia bacterium]|nr:hypothetical protein [Clostridia bacterium]
MKKIFTRVTAFVLAAVFAVGLFPAALFAEDSAPGNLDSAAIANAEFHMTDSLWTVDPETGYATSIDRHPSVYVSWDASGLPETDGSFTYEAELYVAPGPAYRIKQNLEFLAERNNWPAEDPRGICIFGAGNNYWSAGIPDKCVGAEGGLFTGVLTGVYKYDISNACVGIGDQVCWQLLVYRNSGSGSELVLISDIKDASVDCSAGLPYMVPTGMEYPSIYSETYYNWADSLTLEPSETVSFEADFYAWPGWGLGDPYNCSYGWINTLMWSEDPDLNVLMPGGAFVQDLYWFDNTSTMDMITPAPGMKLTAGLEIYMIDKSGGGFEYSLYRRLPAVEL